MAVPSIQARRRVTQLMQCAMMTDEHHDESREWWTHDGMVNTLCHFVEAVLVAAQ
jgi:hypothetical protein